MRRTRTGVLGSLFLLCAAATGCGAGHPHAAAAPRWCDQLSGSRSIAALPEDLGRLTVDPRDLVAQEDIGQARTDLRGLLGALRADHAPTAATTALEDLVAALGTVTDAHPAPDTTNRIGTDLTAAGRAVQAVCEFPT